MNHAANGYEFTLVPQWNPAPCPVCQRRVDHLWVAREAGGAVQQVVCCDACAQPTEQDAAIKRAEQRVRELKRHRHERWVNGTAAREYWAHVGTDFGVMPNHRKTGALRGGVRAQ